MTSAQACPESRSHTAKVTNKRGIISSLIIRRGSDVVSRNYSTIGSTRSFNVDKSRSISKGSAELATLQVAYYHV